MRLVSYSTSAGAGIDLMQATSTSVSRSFIDLPKELFEMLVSAGPYLYRDTLLLQKVVFVMLLFFFLVGCFCSKHRINFWLIQAGLQSAERLLSLCT